MDAVRTATAPTPCNEGDLMKVITATIGDVIHIMQGNLENV
jgi:hypothetical protein